MFSNVKRQNYRVSTNLEFGGSTCVNTLSLSLVVFPFSLIHITIYVKVHALTVTFVIFPLACGDDTKISNS